MREFYLCIRQTNRTVTDWEVWSYIKSPKILTYLTQTYYFLSAGIGVVAIRDIQIGDLIISEEPLLIIPWWVRATVNPR